MKLFKYIFCLVFITCSFVACDDQLELYPLHEVAVEESFQNVEDFNNAVKGLYTGFRRSGYYGATSAAASIYFIPDVISDNVIINANGRRSRELFYDWRYDEDDSSETFWLSAYKVIQRANLILEKLVNLPDGDIKNNFEGQALAARGIAHFDLVKFYAGLPAQGANSDLGVPYVTSVDPTLKPARDTVAETYNSILADLNAALNLIAEDNGRGFLNKSVLNALLSRIHLYMGDWTKVIETSNAVTGAVATNEEFLSIWKDSFEGSVIWKIITTEPDDVSIGVAWFQESPDGIRSEYNVDKSLYDLYADNDIRKAAYFETSDFAGVTYNHIIKYRGRETGNANEVDVKVIRYAEVLLNKAEAQFETGDESGALTTLDELRVNRYAEFESPEEMGMALSDAIALERRLELAFEGHRFFDLKRKGLPCVRSNFGDAADGSGEQAEFKELPANDHRWNMAIGTGEINANSNMVQNSGY